MSSCSQDPESKKSDTIAYANNSKALDLSANVKDQQLKMLHETIRNLQTQLLDNKTKEKENLLKINALENKLKQANVKELLLKTRIVDASKSSVTSISDHTSESDDSDKDVVCVDDAEPDQIVEEDPKSIDSKEAITLQPLDKSENINSNSRQVIDENEARLIGLISSFLVVHPFGASLENILTYVQQVSAHFHTTDVEDVLRRHNSIFNESNVQSSGAETPLSTQNNWKFCGFDQNTNLSTIVIHD